MRVWTAQTCEGAHPALIPEGFSVWALLFGPFWLAFHGAWMLAAIALAVNVVVDSLAPAWAGVGLALAFGVFGHDLRRAALGLRGFALVHVIAARDADAAFARLLDRRPDLIAEAAR